MKTEYLRGKVQLKANGKGITVVASDETLDRHGDVLPIESWDLAKFMLAPRMLVDHDHRVESIVGKWKNTRIENKQLLMDADFHGITELSKAVEKMVKDGYLDTVSVGFIFHGPEKDGGDPSFELIETSWVTVPANPSAQVVKGLLEKALTPEEKEAVQKFDEEPSDDDVIDPPDEEDELEDPPLSPSPAPSEELLFTPELIEEKNYLVIKSKEDLKQWQDQHPVEAVGVVDLGYLVQLLADSEQLQTLTTVEARRLAAEANAKLIRLAMKEAAGIISHSLRELNKVD